MGAVAVGRKNVHGRSRVRCWMTFAGSPVTR